MLEQVRTCMAGALKLDDRQAGAITEQTTAADLPAWTSVSHLSLILELENRFNIRFDNNEIVSLGSVSAIIEKLKEKGVEA